MRRRPLAPVREETPKPWWSSQSETTIYALVATISILCYMNSMNGDFVHDDIPAIVTNGDVTGHSPLYKMFLNDFWGTPMADPNSHKSYRPLTTLTFRMNYMMFGLSSTWWHCCNVVLHATCCVLVARVASVVARLQRPFAAVAALLFAVHPVHTEAVSGIVGRADVLACVCFLASLLVYHGSEKPFIWSSVLLSAISMLSKESGITVLMLNMTIDVYRSWITFHKIPCKHKWRSEALPGRCLRLVFSMLALGGLRLAMLHGSLPAFSPQDNPAAFHPSAIVRLLSFSYLAAMNWWLLLCPSSLSHDWQMGSISLVTSVYDQRNIFTAFASAALIVLLYYCFMDFEMHRHPPLIFGVSLMLFSYLPASNIFFTTGFVIAERILYIPSVGAVVLTSYGIQHLWRYRRYRSLVLLGMMVLVSAGVAKTFVRNRDWRTRESLLRADLAVLPHNAKLHYNFGNFLKDMEQQENAIKHYQEALRLWPSYASAHNNLGTLVVASGQAEYHFMQALRYNKHHINAHYNLGKLFRKKNKIKEALKMLSRCISLAPRFVEAHLELLLITPSSQKREILNKVIQIEPNNWRLHFMYGHWYKEKGWKSHAVSSYLESLKLSLKNKMKGEVEVVRHLSLVLRDLGQRARILQILTRWRSACVEGGGGGVRFLLLAGRLRAELAARASLYRSTNPANAMSSTCLHHSHLETNKQTEDVTIEQTHKQNIIRGQEIKYEVKKLKKTFLPTTLYRKHNKSDISRKNICLKDKDVGHKASYTYLNEDLVKTF